MEHILKKEEMDSVKALANINLKVSEAQNLLFSLQEEETKYLIEREKKAGHRIQKTLEDSEEMLKEAKQNHQEIQGLLTGISEFVGNLLKMQENLSILITDFEEGNVLWEKQIGEQQDGIVEIRKGLKIESVQIENDRKTLEQANRKLIDDRRKLESERGVIDRKIKRFKEGIV